MMPMWQSAVRFEEKKALFLDFFDKMGLEVIGREATLYLWVKVPSGWLPKLVP